MVDIYWSENGQSTGARTNLNANTIPQEMLATHLAHYSSNCNFDVCYHSNSTDTDQNLLEEENNFVSINDIYILLYEIFSVILSLFLHF